jgi:hypothetical protein
MPMPAGLPQKQVKTVHFSEMKGEAQPIIVPVRSDPSVNADTRGSSSNPAFKMKTSTLPPRALASKQVIIRLPDSLRKEQQKPVRPPDSPPAIQMKSSKSQPTSNFLMRLLGLAKPEPADDIRELTHARGIAHQESEDLFINRKKK